jgi:outer membrane protein assembly factor BamB
MVRILSAGALFLGALLLTASLSPSAEQSGKADSTNSTWRPDTSDPAGHHDPLAYWTHWRGPSQQGYVSDDKVPLKWSETENVAWKTKLPGGGHSTPIVYGDHLYLTAANAKGSELYVLCVRTTDGSVLWQQTAAKNVSQDKTHQWNGYASPSCATDGKYVVAFFGTEGLFCYDTEGKQLWHEKFGVFTSEAGWGIAASPIMVGDLVILNCDNDGPKGLPKGGKPASTAPMNLVALDKKTGKPVWQTPRDQGRGFGTPRLMRVAGGRLDLVLNGPLSCVGYDPSSGKVRWQATRSDAGDQMRFGEPLPVNDGQMMFIMSGRPGPCQAFRLPGDGDITKSQLVWNGSRKGHRDVASPILWDHRVYCADNKGLLSCYDLKIGKELFNERFGGGKAKALASPIAVRGKLLFLLDDGATVVVEPEAKLKEVRTNKLGDGIPLDFGASPAVADGRLFLRSQTHLYCISEPK